MLFARFQGTTNIETQSFYCDLERLYEEIYEDDTEEEREELFETYKESLSLRNNITAKELFDKVVDAKLNEDFDTVLDLEDKFKLNGIFCYDLDWIKDANMLDTTEDAIDYIDEYRNLFTGSMVQDDTYLIIFKGEYIHSFDENNDGVLARMKKIIEIR